MSKAKNIKLRLACLEQWMASNSTNQKEAKEESKGSYSNYRGKSFQKSFRGSRGKRQWLTRKKRYWFGLSSLGCTKMKI